MIRYAKDFIKARASRIRWAEILCKFAIRFQTHRAEAHCTFAMPLQIHYTFAMQVCDGQMCPKCTGVRRAENSHQTYVL